MALQLDTIFTRKRLWPHKADNKAIINRVAVGVKELGVMCKTVINVCALRNE